MTLDKKNIVYSTILAFAYLCSTTSIYTKGDFKVITPGQPEHISKSNIIFVHGLGAKAEHARYFTQNFKWGEQNPNYLFKDNDIHTFQFPDRDQNTVNLAQEADIKLLRDNHQKARQDNPEHKNFLLLGISRGASTILNYLATDKPSDVNLVILESPFSQLMDVIQHYHLKWVPFACVRTTLARILHRYLTPWVMKNYNPDGPKPIELAKNIPHNTTILLICSKEDHLIPASSTIKLYKELIASGHPDVYLLVLDHGEHANILQGPDGSFYQQAVHALLKKKGYDFDPILASEGNVILKKAQPTLEELNILK